MSTYTEQPMQAEKAEAQKPLDNKQKEQIRWILVAVMVLFYALATLAQNGLTELNYTAESEFRPTIKDAIKISDIPEISDSVKRIDNIKYGITSRPVFSKYQATPIQAAKLQNEPLNRLYHAVLKGGYAPSYNMPLGELWISNSRSKDMAVGAHLKHFSSTTHLRGVGYGSFADNLGSVYGKRFYKRHTLSGDLNFSHHQLHYYGYDTTVIKPEVKSTRQFYQVVEPRVRLVSHFSDSSQINHDIGLSYYNLRTLTAEYENNVRAAVATDMFVNREKLNVNFLTDFYNTKFRNDTLNDLIVTLNPSFEARGQKWRADMGLSATLDNFGSRTRFYFYPQLNLYYDIYENLVIPYAGVNGGLIKNSIRSLSTENPFIDTALTFRNTHNKVNLFGGLRGNLSTSTSYDARVTYSLFDDMYMYVIDYSDLDSRYNRFDLLYDDVSLLKVSGEVKYQATEKLNIIGKGAYFLYKAKTQQRVYHKPESEIGISAIYNLRSKFIARADLFVMGRQWAYSMTGDSSAVTFKPVQIKGWADMNLELEYRYSPMLSFFAKVNNIANQRYYRWERYPSQRFNFMLGFTFVPF